MSTPQVEYYREISAEDIRLIYAIVGVFSASIFIADVVYLVWGETIQECSKFNVDILFNTFFQVSTHTMKSLLMML